jgi:hypothetical protein
LVLFTPFRVSSQGSKYYINKEEQAKKVQEAVDSMKARARLLNNHQLRESADKIKVWIKEIESRRDLTRFIVCVDMVCYVA